LFNIFENNFSAEFFKDWQTGNSQKCDGKTFMS